MKLSIYQIFESLAIDDSYLITGENVILDLTGVRIYTDYCSKLSSSILYIVRPYQMASILPDPSLHFLHIGSLSKDDIYAKFQGVILVPEQANEHRLLHHLQDIFDNYTEWAESINRAITSRETLQTILELVAKYSHNPIALVDNANTRLLASGETVSNDGAFSNYVETYGHTPERYHETQGFHAMPWKKTTPVFQNLIGQYDGTRLLLAGLYVHDVFFGHLATGDTDVPLTNADYANMIQIQDFMQTALENSPEYQSYISETPQYFTKLIRGEPLKKSVVSYNLKLKKRELSDKFFLWCFRPRLSIPKERSIKDFLPSFMRFLKTDMIFCHEEQIIAIDYDMANYHNAGYYAEVEEFLSVVNFDCAHSLVSSDIFELPDTYTQCRVTIDNTASARPAIHSFRQHYRSYITKVLETSTPFEKLIHPGFIRLFAENEKYGAELLRCLQVYITEGRNISSVARRMFTHRHTVIYRLELISKALDLNLTELDDESSFHLFWSCEFLLNKLKTDSSR